MQNSTQVLHDKEKAARNKSNQFPELNELNSLCLRRGRKLQNILFWSKLLSLLFSYLSSNFCDLLYVFRHVRLSENTFLKQIYSSIPTTQINSSVLVSQISYILCFFMTSIARVFLSVFLGLLLSLLEQQSYQLSMSISNKNMERKLWSVLLISFLCFKHTYSLSNLERPQRIFFIMVCNK